MSACRCDDATAERYGPRDVCWHCWAVEHGSDGSIPEPDVWDDHAEDEIKFVNTRAITYDLLDALDDWNTTLPEKFRVATGRLRAALQWRKP